jgi:hypothetical protein
VKAKAKAKAKGQAEALRDSNESQQEKREREVRRWQAREDAIAPVGYGAMSRERMSAKQLRKYYGVGKDGPLPDSALTLGDTGDWERAVPILLARAGRVPEPKKSK